MSRARGEGTIYRLPDGRWKAERRVTVNGRRRKRSAVGRTRQEAAAKLASLVVDPKPPTASTTFGGWLATYVDGLSIRFTTKLRYKDYVRFWGPLAKLRLRQLTPGAIERLLHDDALASAYTRRYAGRLARAALQRAVSRGWIPANPFATVSLPRVPPKEMAVLDLKEAERFVRACCTHQAGAIFLLALGCGLRIGEVLALQWRDMGVGKLTVASTLRRQERKEVKSRASRRVVCLPRWVAAAIPPRRGAKVWVFATRSGRPWSHSNVMKVFRRLLAKADCPRIRIHDLRHTFASICLTRGVSIRAVAAALGHADPALTLRVYSHIMPGDLDAARVAMEGIVE